MSHWPQLEQLLLWWLLLTWDPELLLRWLWLLDQLKSLLLLLKLWLLSSYVSIFSYEGQAVEP